MSLKTKLPSPRSGNLLNPSAQWGTYRTRFLVRAKQLSEAVAFVDGLGREHSGGAGDYLVESSDGTRRIAPRTIFEDIYVIMDSDSASGPPGKSELPGSFSQPVAPHSASGRNGRVH